MAAKKHSKSDRITEVAIMAAVKRATFAGYHGDEAAFNALRAESGVHPATLKAGWMNGQAIRARGRASPCFEHQHAQAAA